MASWLFLGTAEEIKLEACKWSKATPGEMERFTSELKNTALLWAMEA